MKKHITPKQREELAYGERCEYLKFNKSAMAEHYIDISDMIEFLGNKFDKYIFDSGGGRLTGADGEFYWDNDNICDLLWEAVKFKLKNKAS